MRFGVRHLLESERRLEAAALLTDLCFLEAKAGAGLVFDLADDLASTAHEVLPEESHRDLFRLPDQASVGSKAALSERPTGRLFQLLDQAVRADAQFLSRHPECLFQCLWNRGWWYDSPDAAGHYEAPRGGWPEDGPPWHRRGPKLHTLLERWRLEKERRTPGVVWLRSLRPPGDAAGHP
jgi:hypothetical protein